MASDDPLPEQNGQITYQQHITQDTSQHARLHDPNLVLLQSNDADNQLNRIAECCVEKTTDSLTQLQSHLAF